MFTIKAFFVMVAIIVTLFLAGPRAEAGGFALGSNEVLNTDNIVKDLMGFKDNSTNIILQYLLPKELLSPKEENGPVASWQVDLARDQDNIRISLHYSVSF